jgi:hypothetical protein
MPHRLLAFLVGGLLLALMLPALAAAAPVTVNFRIEGKTRTLYEGPVTTDVGPVDVGDGTGPHACDGTTNPGVTVPGPTRGNAFLSAANGPGGFTFTGTYTFDLQFSVIAGDPVAFNPGTGEFLAEYKNGAFAAFGSCADQIANGDDVLYAYATGSEQLLKLSGPPIVAPGGSATLTVTDAATGLPVAGADVGGVTSGPDGTVPSTLADRGPHSFKASKAGAIRSNRVDVCATDGNDGACGTTAPGQAAAPGGAACATTGSDGLCGTRDSTAPGATLRGIKDGQRFARGKGPRRLRAVIDSDPAGLLAVKLRLTRTDGPRCTYFSGKSERFRTPRGAKCGADNGFWFTVGTTPTVDYLLPRALPRGRYVLDVNAIDRSFNRDDARRRGSNRIVFVVA